MGYGILGLLVGFLLAPAAEVPPGVHPFPGFEPAVGQVRDTRGQPVEDVLFLLRQPGLTLFITERGVSYVLHRSTADNRILHTRVDVDLVGARIRADQVRFEHPLPGVFRYYRPGSGEPLPPIRRYRKVVIQGVYPGVDWIWRVDDGELHHEFHIHPGAAVTSIRLRPRWARSELAANRTRWLLHTPEGTIQDGHLRAYDGLGREIPARYRKEGTDVVIDVEGWDGTTALVVDPPLSLVWATFYGGSDADRPSAVAVDDSGNVYLTGWTASLDFPVQNPGGGAYFQDTSAGGRDAFVIKFTPNGALAWATYYGGSDADFAWDIAVGPGGRVYVVGWTLSPDLVIQNPGGNAYVQPTSAGGFDVFLLRLNAQGVLEWATYYGGSGWEGYYDSHGMGLALDDQGNLFVVGLTYSTDLPLRDPGGGAYLQGTLAGAPDAFVLKFNASGGLEWATYYGGSGSDHAVDVAVDTAGNVYVTGYTNASDFPVQDPGGGAYFQGTRAGGWDAFLIRFTGSGVRTWATYYGGSDDDYARSVATDPSGNAVIAGNTRSSDFPVQDPGGGAYFQGIPGGGYDAFLVRFTPGGGRVWATYYGGGSDEGTFWAAPQVAVDLRGHVYLIGFTLSPDLPLRNPGNGAFFVDTLAGWYDGFLVQFLPDSHTLGWATYYGGTSREYLFGVTTAPGGDLWVVGQTLSSDFPLRDPGGGAYFQSVLQGSWDAVLIRIRSALAPLPFDLVSPPDSLIVGTPRPTFHWRSTRALAGIQGYRLVLDGTPHPLVSDTFGAPVQDLGEGWHVWFVEAVDSLGNATPSREIRAMGVDLTPPQVESTTIWPDTAFAGPFEVRTRVTDAFSGVASVVLYYRRQEDTTWIGVPMDTLGGGGFAAHIPAATRDNDTIRYYIEARDRAQPPQTSTDPPGAPTAAYVFVARQVGVAEASSRLTRFAFSVKQEASGSVHFVLALPREGPVRLRVYDLTGREVQTLIDGTLPPGRYRLLFSPPAPGTYLYRLTTPFRTLTGKIPRF